MTVKKGIRLTPVFSDEYLEKLVVKMNELYVMTRHKYLSMFRDRDTAISKWNTMKNTLTDYRIEKHLLQDYTIGVFSGENLTKYLCFDIDSKSIQNSKHIVTILKETLIKEFNVPKDFIHISFSGKKGYHLEIFFSESLRLQVVENFYTVVMAFINQEYTFSGEIEFRPNYKQGVKLPLSVHLETGNVCWFVDKDTLEPIESYDYLLGIVPMDVEVFRYRVLDSLVFDTYQSNFFTMEHVPASKTETLIQDVQVHQKSNEQFQEDMTETLAANRLMREHSRHNTTVNLAIYLKNTQVSKENAYAIIKSIMVNTWENHRTLIDKNTTYDYMMSEVLRLVSHVYGTTYKKNKKTYQLYKEELLQILEVPNKTLRKMLFSLYIQSKKYASANGVFFMSYSVLTTMGNGKNRPRMLEQLLELEEMGSIEIVQRNQMDVGRTKLANQQSNGKLQKISKTNEYRVLFKDFDKEKEPYLTVQFDKEISIYDATKALVSEKEAKEKLPTYQFYREYKPIY